MRFRPTKRTLAINPDRSRLSKEDWQQFFMNLNSNKFMVHTTAITWTDLPKYAKENFQVVCEIIEIVHNQADSSSGMVYQVISNPLNKMSKEIKLIKEKEFKFDPQELL